MAKMVKNGKKIAIQIHIQIADISNSNCLSDYYNSFKIF